MLTGVREALARLHGVSSGEHLLNRATEELCRRVGFDRSIFFAVDGSRIEVGAVHMEAHPTAAAPFRELLRGAEPQLAPDLWETDMIRQRKAVLIGDAPNDPRTLKLVVEAARTRSYVAAPIAPFGRVAGFFAADCFFARRDVTELDRHALWTFAEGFTHAFEHVLLLERMRAQSREMGALVAALGGALAEIDTGQLSLGSSPPPGDGSSRTASSSALGGVLPASTLHDNFSHGLLTRREREVLGLMAEGATNAMIAERLVISPGTVKSHVKHILRKLHAANRAEAVSRYLRPQGMRA